MIKGSFGAVGWAVAESKGGSMTVRGNTGMGQTGLVSVAVFCVTVGVNVTVAVALVVLRSAIAKMGCTVLGTIIVGLGIVISSKSMNINYWTRQVSSMIHSAKPSASPVAITILTSNFVCKSLKSWDGLTD